LRTRERGEKFLKGGWDRDRGKKQENADGREKNRLVQRVKNKSQQSGRRKKERKSEGKSRETKLHAVSGKVRLG